MTRTYKENHLRFEFGPQWIVEKYDDHRDYREKAARLSGTKAVDFVGVYANAEGFVIEVKDFRGFRLQNKKRLTSGELAEEVALKVRDTLAGLVGAYRTSCDPDMWQPFVHTIANRNKVLKVVLWLEDDMAKNAQEWRQQASTLQNAIKRQTSWVTARVLVLNQQMGRVTPDLTVSDLPGAGHPGGSGC